MSLRRGRSRVVERDRHEQVDEIVDPPRVAPGALLDAPQAVLRGVGVDLQALGGDAQVEVGAGEGADRGRQCAPTRAVLVTRPVR